EGFGPLWPNTIEVILNALCHIQSLLSQSIPGAGITASLFKKLTFQNNNQLYKKHIKKQIST
ncbi:hypothetical protein MJN39_20865, partial [Salmonella enterica subsp. enterica serovar Kentucky]|nr:hypothetical protein [Salmonella enterica subsp. enterica serovar Kentucky]